MSRRFLSPTGLLTALLLVTPAAFADNCTNLTGKTQCFAFAYSTGGSNFYRATFGAGGVFTFPDVSGTTGTWSCPGTNFVETNYSFGGFETQQWLAEALPAVKGHGKSISNSYLYSVKKVANSNCAAAAAAARAPGAAQDR